MTVKRHKVKSCCGRAKYIFEVDSPIKKYHLSIFEKAGFITPKNFKDIGIFYVRRVIRDRKPANVDGVGARVARRAAVAAARRHSLFATAPFGSSKISVYCGGPNCDEELNEFERLIHEAVNTAPGG